jgi:3-oxoacyl-[acyl-carrier protein] reductase
MARRDAGAERGAIVTGASLGIGKAIAMRLAADGAKVLLVGRDGAALKSVQEEIAAPGGISRPFVADLAERAAGEAIVARALEDFGRLDILVNCASATINGDLFSIADDQWSLGFEVKVFAAIRLCRAAWPALKDSRGSIVNIGGIGARTPRAGDAMTGALSASLMAITKSLTDRGVTDGVRVNMINPGLIRTPRTERLIGRSDEAMQAAADRLGSTRPGTPEDVAALVAFIVSREGEHLQGSIIDLDGGATKGM